MKQTLRTNNQTDNELQMVEIRALKSAFFKNLLVATNFVATYFLKINCL